MSLGPAEILVVLVIALLVFGPTRLPEIGRQVGRAMKEFRKFQSSLKADMDSVFSEDVSAHQEPAPALPPKALDGAPDQVPGAARTEDASAVPPAPAAGESPAVPPDMSPAPPPVDGPDPAPPA